MIKRRTILQAALAAPFVKSAAAATTALKVSLAAPFDGYFRRGTRIRHWLEAQAERGDEERILARERSVVHREERRPPTKSVQLATP